MSKLKTPTGLDITGTFESLQGCALIRSAERTAAGRLDLEYDGETEIWWDSQKTEHDKAELEQRLFVDEDGGLWKERELILEDDDE
jgi:hypothetical protein